MITNKSSLSFGQYLKSIRIEKGIDLKAVSNETKVGMDYLLLIEEGAHDRLPAEVFVKGFIRAYAQAIGADGDEAVRRYMTNLQIAQDAARFDVDLQRSGRSFWLRLLFCLGMLLAIMILSVWFLGAFQKNAAEPKKISRAIEEKPRNSAFKEIREPEPVKKFPEPVLQKKLLKVNAVEETWIKIVIDGQNPREYSLKSGDLLELEATTGYSLLVGNATGVQLSLNGNPVKILGKKGQVVTIQIP